MAHSSHKKDIASAAFWVPAFSYKQFKRLAHASSSMKPELAAIVLALTWIDQLNLYTGAVILSDSLSSLMAIKNGKDINFVNEILTLITHLKYKCLFRMDPRPLRTPDSNITK